MAGDPMEGDREMRESEGETQGRDVGWELLSMARHLIDQGKPSQALQAVVMATRANGGDQAVLEFLQRARELYRRKLQSTSAVEQLASLFAECAIAEAQPLGANPDQLLQVAHQSSQMLMEIPYWQKLEGIRLYWMHLLTGAVSSACNAVVLLVTSVEMSTMPIGVVDRLLEHMHCLG